MPSRTEISLAVKDPEWQRFRRSLQGLSTKKKLGELKKYLDRKGTRKAKVQVENYKNALRRAGQLK